MKNLVILKVEILRKFNTKEHLAQMWQKTKVGILELLAQILAINNNYSEIQE